MPTPDRRPAFRQQLNFLTDRVVSSTKKIISDVSVHAGKMAETATVALYLLHGSVYPVAASQSEGVSPTPTFGPRMPGPPGRGETDRGDDYWRTRRPKIPSANTPTATESPSPSAKNTPTRTATAPATGTATAPATASRTETATITRTPESKSAPWPPEALYVLARVRVVDPISYIRTTNAKETGGAISAYAANTNTVYYLIGSTGMEEGFASVYEIGHAHQHRQVMDSGHFRPDKDLYLIWLEETDEGKAFAAASQAVTDDHLVNGKPLPWDWWGINKVEDYSGIFMPWYTGYYPRSWFDDYPSLRDFGQVWLPDTPLALLDKDQILKDDILAILDRRKRDISFRLDRTQSSPQSKTIFPLADGRAIEVVKSSREFRPLARSGHLS